MQQRKSTSARPSGTDGSDYSYRMVVDSRYQQVANGKGLLSVLFPIQAIFLLIVGATVVFPRLEEKDSYKLAGSFVGIGIVSLIIGELGRRRSRGSFLRVYMVASSIAMLLSNASLAKRYSLLEVFLDLFYQKTKQFVTLESTGLLTVILVCIFGSWVIQIIIIKTVISLVGNMSPPKRAS
ncbi:protein jagunal-like 1-like [Quillaja saponaria]|uniref:Protein jagunal-like 1-like n=1 Tax=Quillaja saponaria TaxID=32244 RepID=A0AAD7PBL2_QUISA|nr:protein jagunal-like 1-like [Quillaja saponaria]KAJ7949589.1 protein jagunal-like 1-like [Quillaja saponaria]KAJ7949590.1 protein jagunal-like 1-like [Quillaja saponaria]